MKLFMRTFFLNTALAIVILPLSAIPDHTLLPEAQTSFPITITNITNKPLNLHVDLRVDYYYQHGKNATFLPASKTNEWPTIESGKTITLSLSLPLKLHEPYNTIKTGLRSKKYEKARIVVRGVIGHADEPKKFLKIKEPLKGTALHYLISE